MSRLHVLNTSVRDGIAQELGLKPDHLG